MNITKSKSINKSKPRKTHTKPHPNQTIQRIETQHNTQLIHSQTKQLSKKFRIPQQVNNLKNKKKFQNAKFSANAKTKSPANPKPQMSRNDHRSDQQQQQTLQS